MRNFKRTIAIFLSVLLIASLATVAASAASGTLKVNATSNVASAVSNTYDLAKDSSITLTFKLKAAQKIENTQGYLTYDREYLTLTDFKLNVVKGAMVNKNQINRADFNSTDISDPADFTKGADLVTATFTIVKAGSTDVDLHIDEINATKSDYTSVPVITDGKLVASDASVSVALSASASQKVVKKANPVKVKAVKKTVKAKKLKKKAQTVKKAVKVTKAQGKVTYKKVKKGSTAKLYKKVTVNSKTGAIKIKKGKLAKKTYKLVISVKAAGNDNYKAKTVKTTVKIKVK